MLNQKYNINFNNYKPNTITRRILRRMNLKKIKKAADYVLHLQSVPEELDLLYKDLLISVTSFFREPDLYKTLSAKIFPEIFKNKPPSEALRIWIPACASGEEACSLAITLLNFWVIRH
jgi:two-component system CheB/CheR fusion protein